MTKRKPPAEHKPAGRPSDYTVAIADEICRRIGGGESLRGMCAGPLMPTRATVLNWVRTYPDFFTRYQQAREAQAHYLVEETLDRVRTASTAEEIAKARLMLDATKWAAGKLAPKVYGDVLQEPGMPQPQGQIESASDIVIARQLMFYIHRVATRVAANGSGNGVDPDPSLLGIEHQPRH